MFKNAKWIARRDSMEIEPAPLIRKSFEANKRVSSAKMYVCGLGHGLYYINGKKEIAEINAEMTGAFYTEEDL